MHRKALIRTAVPLVALALTAAACGSSSGSKSSDTKKTTALDRGDGDRGHRVADPRRHAAGEAHVAARRARVPRVQGDRRGAPR